MTLTTYHQEQLAKALAYLRERGLYILDGRFTPTSAAATDVRATWQRAMRRDSPVVFTPNLMFA